MKISPLSRYAGTSAPARWKNKYLLTGTDTAAPVCPIQLANDSIHKGVLPSNSPHSSPRPNRACYCLFTSDFLQPPSGEREKSGHTFLCSHSLSHTHTLTSVLAAIKLPLIFKYSRASISLWLPFSVIFLLLQAFLSSSSQPSLCSLSILTDVCCFWVSLQSIGHI